MAKDSLKNFADVLFSEASVQKQAAVTEFEEKKKQAVAAAKKEAEKNYEKQLKKYEAALEYEVKLDVSRREAEISKVLRKNRSDVSEEVFEAVTEKLIDFAASAEYREYLIKRFDEVSKAFVSDDVMCAVKSCDISLVKEICPVSGVKIKETSDDIIGGFTLKSEKLKLYADCTLKSELEKQKNLFCKISGLVIE